jgi:hypothetical protein
LRKDKCLETVCRDRTQRTNDVSIVVSTYLRISNFITGWTRTEEPSSHTASLI